MLSKQAHLHTIIWTTVAHGTSKVN